MGIGRIYVLSRRTNTRIIGYRHHRYNFRPDQETDGHIKYQPQNKKDRPKGGLFILIGF
jgi:hypothetical protein